MVSAASTVVSAAHTSVASSFRHDYDYDQTSSPQRTLVAGTSSSRSSIRSRSERSVVGADVLPLRDTFDSSPAGSPSPPPPRWMSRPDTTHAASKSSSGGAHENPMPVRGMSSWRTSSAGHFLGRNRSDGRSGSAVRVPVEPVVVLDELLSSRRATSVVAEPPPPTLGSTAGKARLPKAALDELSKLTGAEGRRVPANGGIDATFGARFAPGGRLALSGLRHSHQSCVPGPHRW